MLYAGKTEDEPSLLGSVWIAADAAIEMPRITAPATIAKLFRWAAGRGCEGDVSVAIAFIISLRRLKMWEC